MVTREDCIKSLNEIAALKKCWNNNFVPAFSEEVIKKAEEFIDIFPRYPEIFPTSAGSIQLEWGNKDGKYLEIEVFSRKEVKVFIMNGWDYHHGKFLFKEE